MPKNEPQYAMFRSPKERIRLHQGKALQDRRREFRGFNISNDSLRERRGGEWEADSSIWITSFFFPLLCAPLLLSCFALALLLRSCSLGFPMPHTIMDYRSDQHRDYDHVYLRTGIGN
jgi:hypothetical protein